MVPVAINLVPPIRKCCGTEMKLTPGYRCTVYRYGDKPVAGQLFCSKCEHCNSKYSVNTMQVEDGEFPVYYESILDGDYFVSTGQTVFNRHFLESTSVDM